MNRAIQLLAVATAALFSGSAFAAVSTEEAKQLGTTLTPWGAEKAGNKEGTIPEWSGQVKLPANYDPRKPGVRPDPFANEKPLFAVNAQNMDKYADKLTAGLKAMMKKYPGFRIDVYPSHRTAVYPQFVIDNTVRNATSCKTIDNGLVLEGCYGGLPFPIPKTGNEAMWNHTMRFTASSWYSDFSSAMVDSSGSYILTGRNVAYQDSPLYHPKRSGPAAASQIYWRLRIDLTAPARKTGEKLVIVDPVDPINVGRRVWQYLPGQRRVKLAPDVAYDTPSPQSGGAQGMDDAQIFLGAQDRFSFKLLGKREMFIPYNEFKLADGAACPHQVKYLKNHMNPDCVRFELHRVYVIEANLKPGFRHAYSKRVFYFDEDAPGAGIGDNFDASGNIYRVTLGSFYPMYEAQGLMSDESATHDLQTGIYAVSGDVAESGGWYTVPQQPDKYYTGEALAAEGVR